MHLYQRSLFAIVLSIFSFGFSQNQDINLTGNGSDIFNGGSNSPSITNNTDFGDVEVSSSSQITYTIQNTKSGGSPRNNKLTVSNISISGTNASDFVVSGISLPKSINRSNSTTFNITFTASIIGVETAFVSISSDDPDENPYTFNISGTGIQAGTNPSLTLTNTYALSVLEPSGLAYDKVGNQLFTVSDNSNLIYRLSLTGVIQQTYGYSGNDLEGVSMYTTNKLLVAEEGNRELVEYDYVIDDGTFIAHTMNTNSPIDGGAANDGLEGVTYDSVNDTFYFLIEKNNGGLYEANGNFSIINEYEDPLAHGGDYSGSYYVEETGFLWLASDQTSTIYKCNTDGTVIDTFPVTTAGGGTINKLEGIAIDHANQLLYAVSDLGQELYIFSINEGGSQDTEVPSAPTSLIASNTTYNSTDLSWTASTDNVGVTGYDVYQDGGFVANVSGTTYAVTGLSPSTLYAFHIIARDAAGNSSASSNSVNVTTDVFVDTEAPTNPTGLSASNTTETSTDLSWNASTDNIGVTGYDVYQDGGFVTNVSGTTYQVTGLTENTAYAFYVISNDAAGNSSGASNTVNETTLAAPTCTDGIQNGDETGIDCGGSVCDACTGGSIVLHQGFFETGWDGWTDGGSDAARYSGSRSYEGSFSIRLRDNSGTSSSMTLTSLDLSSYNQVEIDFYFYASSMENGEDFWLRYHDGSNWITVGSFVSGTDFNNNTFYNVVLTLDEAQYTLASNGQFRFQNDASNKNDLIYIDQVTITGINGAAARRQNDRLVVVGRLFENTISEIRLYPNPVKGGVLTVELLEDETFTFRIVSITGKTIMQGTSKRNINVSNLDSGMYFIEINNGGEVTTKKFIKQ